MQTFSASIRAQCNKWRMNGPRGEYPKASWDANTACPGSIRICVLMSPRAHIIMHYNVYWINRRRSKTKTTTAGDGVMEWVRIPHSRWRHVNLDCAVRGRVRVKNEHWKSSQTTKDVSCIENPGNRPCEVGSTLMDNRLSTSVYQPGRTSPQPGSFCSVEQLPQWHHPGGFCTLMLWPILLLMSPSRHVLYIAESVHGSRRWMMFALVIRTRKV